MEKGIHNFENDFKRSIELVQESKLTEKVVKGIAPKIDESGARKFNLMK